MTVIGETATQREARRARQAHTFPELGMADERTVFDVDTLRRSEGRPPTSFGAEVDSIYARLRPPDAEYPAGRLLSPTLDRPPAPPPEEPGFFDRAGDVLRNLGDTAGDALRISTAIPRAGLRNLQRPGAAIRGALQSGGQLPIMAGPLSQGLDRRSAEGARSGFLNPEDAPTGMDLGVVQALPDRGLSLGPVNLTPRTVAGFAYDAATDPLTYVGGPPAAKGAKRGAKAIDDFLGDAPAGYVDPARRGVLRAQIIPGVGPDELADGGNTATRAASGGADDALKTRAVPHAEVLRDVSPPEAVFVGPDGRFLSGDDGVSNAAWRAQMGLQGVDHGGLASRVMGMQPGSGDAAADAAIRGVLDGGYMRVGTSPSSNESYLHFTQRPTEAQIVAAARYIQDVRPASVSIESPNLNAAGIQPRDAVRALRKSLDTAPAGELADVRPFPVGGTPARTPDEVLASAQSEAARLYAVTARKAEEPVYGGVVDALEQAAAAVRTDPQGVVSRLAGKIPGLRAIRDWDRPGLTMEKRLLEGHIARRGVETSLVTGQSAGRYDAIRLVDDVLGEGASTGARVLDDLRIPDQHFVEVGGKMVEYPGSGTVYDLLQRPYAYQVGDEVRRVAEQWAKTDEGMRALINERYGTDIGHFVPTRGGVYVANVNVSQARQATLENLARGEALTITGTGKSKTRVFETGFDRWANDVKRAAQGIIKQDAIFVPETDLRVLGYTSDMTKAKAAGNMTMRAATGGRTISEVKELVAPGLVEQRGTLRKGLDSLRGRIQRAEQSLRRDNAVASRLDDQVQRMETRAEVLDERADRLFEASGGSDALTRAEAQLAEVEMRIRAIDKAARETRMRSDLTDQAIPMLREDLLALKDEYADVKRAYDAVGTQDFVQPQNLPGRYFPSSEAVQIDQMLRPAKDNLLVRVVEGLRSQVLAGDIGPLTGIQGIIAAASGRAGTTRAVVSALADGLKGVAKGEPGALLRPYTQDAMETFIRENADLVKEYAFYTGRNVGGRLPAEVGQGGVLSYIPGFVDANEAMFNVATRRQIEMFRRIKDDLVQAGYSPEEGAAAAADLSNKVLPLMTPSRLGQSAGQAQEQRFLPTSLGFIRQPLALTEEAFSTLGKLAAGKTVSPREKLALSIYAQMMGNLTAVAVTTAGINALARQDDPVDAMLNALDPNARAFMGVSVGGQTIPLASPFRAPLRVGIGTLRNILNFGVERATGVDIGQDAGASPIDYAANRIGPPIRATFGAMKELTAAPWERKYQGDNDLLRLMTGAGIFAAGAAPIPAVGIGEEVAKQAQGGEFDPARLAAVASSEAASLSLVPEEPVRTLDVKAQAAHGVPFTELTPKEQTAILLADPKLAETSERKRRERVAEQLDESGYTEIAPSAWQAIRSLSPDLPADYAAYRAAKMPALEDIARAKGNPDPSNAAAQMFGRLSPVKQYRDLLASRRKAWAMEHAKDGMAQLAVDYNFLDSNEDIRRILTVIEPVRPTEAGR